MSKFTIYILIFLISIFICTTLKKSSLEDSIYTSSYLDNPIVFTCQKIPSNIYEKMLGKSIPINCKDIINIDSLSYLKISYWGFDNKSHIGEMIVNANIDTEILDIFKELYEIKYPIEKIELIDNYDANDELSMSNNNTSCFCYRTVSGSNSISNHAKGTAIDINPLYNPYVTKNHISPVSGSIYADRSINNEHQITQNSKLYKIFINHGWSWGRRLVYKKRLSTF